ncbi:MAG TPA: hypothetical protein VHD32_08940 [Candidatus Didemnitutus sp.]|nr:hypothetical protein [Candidatus Didemnitutus sp.]
MASRTHSHHTWKFFRTGGLDQVALETAEDLLNLEKLDQKLWVAWSCPVKGLEVDEATLKLIDTDHDGRIRVPELIAAVNWAAARLKDPADLLRGAEALPLAAIGDATAEGAALLSSARQILVTLGKREAGAITAADSGNTAQIFAASPLNGDGVIPPEATEDPAVQALIKDIIACTGGSADRTGSIGVTAAQIDAFFGDLAAYVEWVGKSGTKEIAVLGEGTEAAVKAVKTVRAKVEDYFARCRLAAFDERATAALNRSEVDFAVIAAKSMSASMDDVAALPLAHVAPRKALPLLESVNPSWAGAMVTLHQAAVAPVLGAGVTTLTESQWAAVNASLASYEAWLGGKAGSAVEKLGLARMKEILAGQQRAQLADLVTKDKALEPEFKAISDVDRLVHYFRDMRTVLHNFVNFADFFSRDRWAVFQAGTLYLDSRSTELCVRVDGANPLAAMSKAYIVYCACTREGASMTIAACFTRGDSDYVFVGRHGVFYDRQGRDWDAVITSIVDNPISIRQAFWSPYKKFVRMIEEQVAKRAAAADAESSAKLAGAAEKTANVGTAGAPPAPPKKIDVGAVAAIGVAITGAISALTLILGYLFQLRAWQYPLVLVGLIVVISGPSMVIAWLKLRQRTIGPILEANGWAINGRVQINIPFGTALTELAVLPPGSRRTLDDPYDDTAAKARSRQLILLFILLLVAAAGWVRWDHNQHGHYFWEPAPAAPAAPAAKPAPAPAATAEPKK